MIHWDVGMDEMKAKAERLRTTITQLIANSFSNINGTELCIFEVISISSSKCIVLME